MYNFGIGGNYILIITLYNSERIFNNNEPNLESLDIQVFSKTRNVRTYDDKQWFYPKTKYHNVSKKFLVNVTNGKIQN